MAEHIAHEKPTITFDRRTFIGVAGSAAVAAAGLIGYNIAPRSGSNNEAPAALDDNGDTRSVVNELHPTEEPTLVATEEPLAEQGDIAMANPPILAHIEGVYKEGETTPGTYLEAGSIVNIKRMFQIPDDLLEGLEGEHAEYIDEVIGALGDITKLGRTEEEIMESMPPEFFASTVGMNPDQMAAHNAKVDSAIDGYVNAKVDEYADTVYEAMVVPGVGVDKHRVSAYSMVVQLLETSLRMFAEHVREYKNTAWKMSLSAVNPVEDMRGESVGVDAGLIMNVKGWSSDGEVVSNATERAKISFMGASERGGVVGTAFMADYSEEYESFMEALEQLSRAGN